jgi:hypothetical protein
MVSDKICGWFVGHPSQTKAGQQSMAKFKTINIMNELFLFIKLASDATNSKLTVLLNLPY